MRALLQLAKHLATELALSALGVVCTFLLASRGAFSEALAVTVLAPLTLVFSSKTLWRAGTLQFAWRCPRVDALGLPLPHDPAGRRAAEAGEAVLSALDGDARAYRDFFPGARRDVRLALRRALDPRAPLEEVAALTRTLREIEQRLRDVRTSRAGPEPLAALEQMHQRSQALAAAVDELDPRRNVIPIRSGGRS